MTPATKRNAVAHLKGAFGMSEWRTYKAIDCCRMTVPYESGRPDDRELRERMKAIANTATAPTWENGYCESFNSKFGDELLNGEIFHSLAEAKVIIEAWRRYYNTERPHSSLGYRRRQRQA